MKTIGGSAFRSIMVEAFVFPPSVETIGSLVFQTGMDSTVFKVCVLPASLKSITGQNHFYGRLGMRARIFKATTPPTLERNPFGYTGGYTYVPDESLAAYKAADIWSSIELHTFSELAIDYPEYYAEYITGA